MNIREYKYMGICMWEYVNISEYMKDWITFIQRSCSAPRSPPLSSEISKSNGIVTGGYLICPFERVDGSTVLINHGWVSKKDYLEVKQNLVSKERQYITGLIVPGEEKLSTFTLENDFDAGQLYWLDLAGLTAYLGYPSMPLLIDEVLPGEKPTSSSITPKSIESFLEFHITPWKHASYALTWYVGLRVLFSVTRINILIQWG